MSAGKIVITDRISIIDLHNLSIKTINFIYLIDFNYHSMISIVFVDQFMRGMWCIKIDEASSGVFYSLKS
jgi:hypothetical protein